MAVECLIGIYFFLFLFMVDGEGGPSCRWWRRGWDVLPIGWILFLKYLPVLSYGWDWGWLLVIGDY